MPDPTYRPPLANHERGKPREELLRRWRAAPPYARRSVTTLLEDYGRANRSVSVAGGGPADAFLATGAEAYDVAGALLETLADGGRVPGTTAGRECG
jgi:hypothetical protein